MGGGQPARPPDAFERRILLAFAGVALLGLLALGFVRVREETVSFDLDGGGMRIDRYLLGFQYASEPIVSHLEWIGELRGHRGPGRWVAMTERHSGALLRGGSWRRRIGQVYVDACTLARILHHGDPPRLRAAVDRISAADGEAVWVLREQLRAEFAQRRAAPLPR